MSQTELPEVESSDTADEESDDECLCETTDPGCFEHYDVDVATDDIDLILEADAYLFDGFGSSQFRFLHDVTVNEDGTRAYLANWDAGLVLLDISDPADLEFVSQAIDTSAGDGKVNSHQAWPSEDGNVVVETEEDFDPFTLEFEITDGPNAGEYDAVEGTFTTPVFTLPDGTRGRGDSHGGESRDIPGVFVGHSTGLAIFDADDADDLPVGDTGGSIKATTEPERWGKSASGTTPTRRPRCSPASSTRGAVSTPHTMTVIPVGPPPALPSPLQRYPTVSIGIDRSRRSRDVPSVPLQRSPAPDRRPAVVPRLPTSARTCSERKTAHRREDAPCGGRRTHPLVRTRTSHGCRTTSDDGGTRVGSR